MKDYQMTKLSMDELETIEGGIVLMTIVGVSCLVAGFAGGYYFASAKQKKMHLVELNSNELEESVGGCLALAIAACFLAGYATGCAILYIANK